MSLFNLKSQANHSDLGVVQAVNWSIHQSKQHHDGPPHASLLNSNARVQL